MTPGEKAETSVHDRDARKAEVKQKKEKATQNHQATRIDDEVQHDMIGKVVEVLGLGGWKGSGIENMPPTDPKTGKYVTGKSKIERLPDKKPRKQK